MEGDSAGGSAKQARDREFQAIMPLRGKILNTWGGGGRSGARLAKVHDISVAIGLDPDSDDLSGLRYGKVCILADADSTVCTSPPCSAPLCEALPHAGGKGHVYVAMPPLYRIDIGKEVFYALDEDEKNGVLQQVEAEKKKGKVMVTRFRGWVR